MFGAKDKPASPDVQAWFRHLRSLPFVPEEYRRPLADFVLAARPVTNNIAMDDAITKFVDYFKSFWLRNDVFPLWGHWLNFTCRTTNIPEGWHNGLHSRLHNRHPEFAVFVTWLRKSQFMESVRIEGLLNGSVVPVPVTPAIQKRND